MNDIPTTAVYASIGVLSQGVLGLMFVLVWRHQRKPWAALFAGGHLITAVFFALKLYTYPTYERPSLVPVLFALPAVLLMTLGYVRYVDLPRVVARWVEGAAAVVATLLLVAVVAGVIGRVALFGVLASFLACQAVMALWGMRREPGSGHGLVFSALMLFPVIVVLAAQGIVDPRGLGYIVLVPLTVSGITVLTTGLLRAQRRATEELQRREQAETALQSLNETLEQRVLERTGHLHEMVVGLESFNRSVSHDLRGPLGGMAGVSRLASEALSRADAVTAQRMLSVITVQADALGQLVTDLLSLARVNDADLAPQPIDLQVFVRDTLEQMRLDQPDRQPLPVDVGELPTVEADPGLLRQVYVNLLGNAVKFSRDAHPPHIEVGAFARDGEQVLYVRDNGIGFDAAQAERLFEPFRRLHGQKYPGHGVGLSIVKRIVERHGGRLWAQAKPDAGATFFFSLPAAHSAH
ncbi:MAG: HAMP domain-containing histidine kinase [Cytophagales bacterium]|nr:HAMP domain-containing histidine kinase [Rhizobacter sp.]